jgi:hypothetical protein
MNPIRNPVVILVCSVCCAIGLASCQDLLYPTPTALQAGTATPTVPNVVIQPTNPAGYLFPINLYNVTLTCTSSDNYLLEFEYLPANSIIDSISDPNNVTTNLICAYRTKGHGVCSGRIDFGTAGVVSFQVCISQAVRAVPCPPVP